MPKFFQVLTTTDSQEGARALAHSVVGSRLAACVQIVGPIQSIFRWRGGVEVATEWLCILKTTQSSLDDLIRKIKLEHTYETPEVTATEIAAGDRAYLDWIEAETPGRTRPSDRF